MATARTEHFFVGQVAGNRAAERPAQFAGTAVWENKRLAASAAGTPEEVKGVREGDI